MSEAEHRAVAASESRHRHQKSSDATSTVISAGSHKPPNLRTFSATGTDSSASAVRQGTPTTTSAAPANPLTAQPQPLPARRFQVGDFSYPNRYNQLFSIFSLTLPLIEHSVHIF